MIVAYPCRYGTLSIDSGDNPIQASLKEYGEWAQNEINFLAPYIQSSDIVIHAGTHVGALLLAFSSFVGKGGHVIGFEPQQQLFKIVSENVTANNLTNVTLFNHALGAKDHTYWINELPENVGGNRGATPISETAIGHPVEVKAFDSLDLDLPSCRLVHLDVEEYELKVLQGMKQMLLRCTPYLYLENLTGTISEPLRAFLEEIFYDYTPIELPAYFPFNFNGNEVDIFNGATEKALFCSPSIL